MVSRRLFRAPISFLGAILCDRIPRIPFGTAVIDVDSDMCGAMSKAGSSHAESSVVCYMTPCFNTAN